VPTDEREDEMPDETGTLVDFDRTGAIRVLEALSKALEAAKNALGTLTDETVAARIILGGGVRPTPIPPILAGSCLRPIMVGWEDLHASEAFAIVAPHIHALLVEMERRDKLPRTLSEISGS
jgi:hypothetical protein